MDLYIINKVTKFNKNFFGRGLPQTIPDTTIPQDIPDTVSQIGSKVTGLGNLIPSQISSAIASVETVVNQDLHSILPKAFSVGTTSACIVEDSDTQCQNFPMKLSDLPDAFQKVLPLSPPLKSLVDYLTNKPSLEVILILGLIFNIASTTTYALNYWFPKLRYSSVGLSLISLILLAIFTGFTQEIKNFVASLRQIGTVQRGQTYYGLCGSIPHALISIISILFKPNSFRMPTGI